MSTDLRPTSPHLSIYRWQITMLLSILHRMTGIGLGVGAILMLVWLYVAAYSPADYAPLQEFMAGIFGCLLMLGWTVAFYFHLANGVRHLFWDMGKGFTIPQTIRSGWMVIIFTALMTVATWYPLFTQTN